MQDSRNLLSGCAMAVLVGFVASVIVVVGYAAGCFVIVEGAK